MIDDLVAWLRQQLDEDEAYAQAASQTEWAATPTGEHWVWECETTDQPVALDPAMSEYVEGVDYSPVGLRSVEQYPSLSGVGMLAHLVIDGQQEIRVVDAAHIARHDPARVLRDVEAKRRILDVLEDQRRRVEQNSQKFVEAMRSPRGSPADELLPGIKTHGWTLGGRVEALEETAKLLALPYSDRPEYREEWKP